MATIITLPRNPFSNRLTDLQGTTLNPDEQDLLIAMAIEVLAARHQRGTALCSPDDTKAYLRLWFGERRREVFGVLYLDTKHRVLAIEVLVEGTLDGATVFPRTVVEQALHHNAGAAVLFHNHPSGVADASQADRVLTERLRAGLTLIDVRVLDHLIVTATDALSFAEKGWL